MTLAWLNKCIWLAGSTGTLDFVVSAAQDGGYVPSGCNNPAVVDGATYHYFAVNGTEHEEGTGTWTTSTSTLARTTVRNSSNSGSKVNFSSAPTVYMGTPAAEDMVTLGSVISLTVTNSSVSSVTLQDATSSQSKLTTGVSSSVNLNGLAAAPGSQILFTPNGSSVHNTFDIRGVNSRVQISAQGGAVDPMIVLADTDVFGQEVLHGGNKAGMGFSGKARASSGGPVEFNFIAREALSGSPIGAEQSCCINIWGTSTLGDTQNLIIFFNGTGTNAWNGTLSATQAGMRLGEICGCGTLPDGNFTETETWSINGYAETNFSGTTADGSYTAPSNIVIRVAPNSMGPERITAVFDYNANLLIGTAWSINSNSPSGSVSSGIVVRGAPANLGQLSIKYDKVHIQAISIQNDSGTDGGGGYIMLVHNGAGTQIGSISHNGSNVSYNTSSDRRLKKDIRNADVAEMADIVSRLTVVRHGWNSHDHETYGFIAQDEYLVFPDAVTPGDDEALNDNSRIWQRDDSKLVVPLVGAVQHLSHRVDEIERKLAA